MSEEQDNQKKLDALKKMNAEHEKENKFLLKKKETLEESLELLQKTGRQAIKNNEAADHAVKTQRINADLAEHSVREQALKLKQMREEQKETGVRDEAALATQQDIVDKAREHADALAASAENAEIGNGALSIILKLLSGRSTRQCCKIGQQLKIGFALLPEHAPT